MSFQGPGSGISGYSAQFTVGYANSAGNINGYAPLAGQSTYATYAGSAANINSYAPLAGQSTYAQTAGYAPQAGYANQAAAYTNGNIGGRAPVATYADNAGTAGNINGYAPQAGYANTAGYANNLAVQGIGGTTWAWAGQPGIPNHYWGSNDGANHLVWQGNQGYVGYAGSAGNINGYAPNAGYAGYAGSAGNINGYAPNAGYAGYAGSAGNINGYAPVAGNVQQGGSYPVWVTGAGNIYATMGQGSSFAQMYYPAGINQCNGNQAAGYQTNISAYFGYSVLTGGRFYVVSDKRVKKRVTDEERPQYIDTVNKLQVERYTYIDTVKEGTGVNTGFFSQDVESVIPEAVSIRPDFIPNVYKLSEKVDINTKTITCKDHKLEKGDYIRYMLSNDEDGVQKVLYSNISEVIDTNNFIIENGDGLTDEIFIYGKEIEDFKVLVNDKILPHTVGAIQELYNIITDLQKRVEKLETFTK